MLNMVRCPAVQSEAHVLSKQFNGSSWFSAQRLSSDYLTLCCEGIRVSPGTRALLSAIWSQTICVLFFHRGTWTVASVVNV